MTTTPRQRIALRREMVRQPAGSPVAEELSAPTRTTRSRPVRAMGSCSSCPVGINTGDMIKGFRGRGHNRPSEWSPSGSRGATGSGAAARVAPPAAGSAGAGDGLIARGQGCRAAWSIPTCCPLGSRRSASPRPRSCPVTSRAGATAVYFPACINRIFGASRQARRRPGGASSSAGRRWRARGCRCGYPATWPGTAARPCGSKGYDRGNA